MFDLKLSQAQQITFVMVDAGGNEVSGIGGTFTLSISKAGGAFVAGVGAKAEIASGWYSYTLTSAETDTIGPLSITVTSPGCLQQNLEYVVMERAVNSVEFTYTVTSGAPPVAIEGVAVWVTTDIAGSYVVWSGETDTLGVARDADGNLPRLDPGSYFFWSQRAGYVFTNPDLNVVS